MKIKKIIMSLVLIIVSLITIFIIVSCTKKEKTIEDYNVSEVLDLANADYNNIILKNDSDYLSTIDISKNFDAGALSMLIDKRTLYDKDTTNSRIIKNNMIKIDSNDDTNENLVLDYDQEQYRVLSENDIVYYQKSIKNEIVLPWEKYIMPSKLMDEKNNIVCHLFNLVNDKDFIVEKITKDNSSDNNILTLKGKLNSIELLDNLSTEFINSKTFFLNDIDFDVTVVINELDKGYRFKSIILNSINSDNDLKFNITASCEMKDIDVDIPNNILSSKDMEISYDEYLQSALIDTGDPKEIYDKLNTFTNEFYDLYDKENFITGKEAKELGKKFLEIKQGKYFESREKVFSDENYWQEKAKSFGSDKDEELKKIKRLFSGNLSGKKAIDQYKQDPSTFAFNTQVENGMYKISIYSDLSMDCEDQYGFPIFERNYECISIYTNEIGIKIYEFKSKENRNDLYKYIKFIEDDNYYNEYKNETMIIKFSDEQGQHYFDDKDAFHIYVFEKENATEQVDQYIIDFMFDVYQKKYYDVILSKVEEVLDNN